MELGWEQAMDHTAVNRPRHVKSSVRIIVGDLDGPEVLRAAKFVAGGIQDARIAAIEGAAHLTNWEEPRKFILVVTEFLPNLADT